MKKILNIIKGFSFGWSIVFVLANVIALIVNYTFVSGYQYLGIFFLVLWLITVLITFIGKQTKQTQSKSDINKIEQKMKDSVRSQGYRYNK